MAIQNRIYRCTDSGLKAWGNAQSGLPAPYRRVLGLIQGDTHSDVLLAALHEHAPAQVFSWLDELETLRFVKSAPAAAQHHLEFTGGLSVAAVFAQYKAALAAREAA